MMVRPLLIAALALFACAAPAAAQWMAGDEARWFEFRASLKRHDDELFQKLGLAPIDEVQAAGRVVRRLYNSSPMFGDLAVEVERLEDGTVRLIAFAYGERDRRVETTLGTEAWPRLTRGEGSVFPPAVFRPSPPGTPPPPPPLMCHASFAAFSTGPEGVRHEWYYCQEGDRSPEVVQWMTTLEHLATEAYGCPVEARDAITCLSVLPILPTDPTLTRK